MGQAPNFYRVLQFLDLLKDIEVYAEIEKDKVVKRLRGYVLAEGITKMELDQYIGQYPDRVYRNLYEMGLFSVFAS